MAALASAVYTESFGDAVGGGAFGSLAVAGQSSLTGPLTCAGGLSSAGVSSTGALTVAGNSTLSGQTACSSGLTVAGMTSINSLAVSGASTLTGAVVCNSSISVGGAVSGFPIVACFNGSTQLVNAKVWCGVATTTNGQATFYPTVTGAAGGAPLFSSILTAQANVILATTNAANIPFASIYSASVNSVVVNAIVAFSAAKVANGTTVTCWLVGL